MTEIVGFIVQTTDTENWATPPPAPPPRDPVPPEPSLPLWTWFVENPRSSSTQSRSLRWSI